MKCDLDECARKVSRYICFQKEMPLKVRAQAVTTTAQRPESWEERIANRLQRF